MTSRKVQFTSARPRGGSAQSGSTQSGFSLLELLVAMGVTLIIMGMASTLLGGAFGTRLREDRRSDALADAQRSLNIMSREIANSGMSLPSPLTYTPSAGAALTVPSNGLLTSYCNDTSIAFVSNLDGLNGNTDITGDSEALLFTYYSDASGRNFLVRKDLNTNTVSVLANRIDGIQFVYTDRNPTTGALTTLAAGSAPTANTMSVRITAFVLLPEIGTPGSPDYHPASRTQLTTEVVLRNSVLKMY